MIVAMIDFILDPPGAFMIFVRFGNIIDSNPSIVTIAPAIMNT